MNKTFLSAALVAATGFAAMAPQSAFASDGKITFTGEKPFGDMHRDPGSGCRRHRLEHRRHAAEGAEDLHWPRRVPPP